MHGPESGCWLAAIFSPSPLCGGVCCLWSGSLGVPLLTETVLRTAHLTAAWLQLRGWERFLSLKSASINEWSCIRLPWLYTRSPSKLYLSSFSVSNCLFSLFQKLFSTQFCWFNYLSDCSLKHIVKLHMLFGSTAVFKTFYCCPVFYGLFSCADATACAAML